ncbi:uncharacterized protein [Anoplolepis gracilipes]
MYDMYGEFKNKHDVIVSLMYTIYHVGLESEMELFLENTIVEDSEAHHITQCSDLIFELGDPNIEMILLEEADLYAVINCLKIENAFFLSKIWVHESIKQTFQLHIKKCSEHLSVPIHIFQSKRDLLTSEILMDSQIRIISIWSEDIVGARNLAMSLKKDVIFINTYMTFCAGIVFPYSKIYYNKDRIFQIKDKCTEEENNSKCIINPKRNKSYNQFRKYYELFYNGTWQKPLENTYWIHNDILLANATSEDIKKCMKSAVKGFKIWSAESINSRMAVLSRLALILESKGETLLADTVSKWLKLPYFCINPLTRHETEQFEITKVREPKGILILEEKDKVTMFRELTQSLIFGNSIIVVCNPNLCTLESYCDMFSCSIMPPGVINLLSSINLKQVKYDDFSKSNPEDIYLQLTINKYIVVCLK